MNSPTETPDLINLMEWNQFAEDRKTLLEALTILNNRHRATAAELNQRLIDRQESFTAQVVRIEDTWREKLLTERAEKDAKIAEQAVQIVVLRGCLEHLTSKDWYQDGEDEKVVCVLNGKKVRAALSTPAPKVVLLEDVTPLLDALKIIAANPGASHGPSCLYDSGPIATGAIAKFTTKHPQP